MAIVAHYITGHEQTQLNRICFFFHFFGVFLSSKGSKFSELIDLIHTLNMSNVLPI